MENNSLDNPTREFVWKINKTPKMKAKTPKNSPNNIRELVEKQFQSMSMVLFDKINTLENEIKSIKKRNAQLEQQVDSIHTPYTTDAVYEPWYL